MIPEKVVSGEFAPTVSSAKLFNWIEPAPEIVATWSSRPLRFQVAPLAMLTLVLEARLPLPENCKRPPLMFMVAGVADAVSSIVPVPVLLSVARVPATVPACVNVTPVLTSIVPELPSPIEILLELESEPVTCHVPLLKLSWPLPRLLLLAVLRTPPLNDVVPE